MTEYNLLEPWKTLDPWQQEYIDTEGNCFLLCGRQCGKTTAMSIKFGKRAATRPNRTILMVAYTEKQAYNLFFKTLMYLQQQYPKMIKKGKDKPTQHEIALTNGSLIMCYAVGLSGEGIRTYTVTDLVVDEAAPMNREIFIAISPMISVTGGSMDVSSTPRGKEGYFYECSLRDDFKKFYVNAEDCPRHKKEFLEAESKRMTRMEYAQEYKAQFLDELRRLFSDDLLKKCCILKRRETILKERKYYLGCDIAGLGGDENTFEILQKISDDSIEQVENMTEKRSLTTETTRRILALERLYVFKKIGIDDGGTGFGVFSELLDSAETKRKTLALNNAVRPIDKDGTKSKRLLKEEMYTNLISFMEQGKLKLLDDAELILSLKSIQYEDTEKNGRKTTAIFGSYSHITEGLIRAAWLCESDKSLDLWCR